MLKTQTNQVLIIINQFYIFPKFMRNLIITILNSLLYSHQFGFRSEHFTHHALIALVDKVSKALGERDMMIGNVLKNISMVS